MEPQKNWNCLRDHENEELKLEVSHREIRKQSKLLDISLGNDFLDLTPKAKATEAK